MRALCALLLVLLLPDKILTQTNIEKGISSRIIGGTQAKVGAYPWFTALVPSTEFKKPKKSGYTIWCGASLISKNKIITAAHCYYYARSRGEKWMSIYTAIFDLKNRCTLDFQISSPILKVEMHPLFNIDNFINDIAIATLEQPISIPPVSLAPKGRGGIPARALIIVYGTTTEEEISEPCKLAEAKVDIYARADCLRTNIATEIEVLPGAICAGVPIGGRDSCQGDSGGPLVKKVKDNLVLQGITSFGDECGRPNYPGIYTDISFYRDWIDQKLNVSRSTKRHNSLTQLELPQQYIQIFEYLNRNNQN